MKLLFTALIGALALACSGAAPTPFPVVPATEVQTAEGTLPLLPEDRGLVYRGHRTNLDNALAELGQPTATGTEILSVCGMLGQAEWDVVEMYLHPSTTPRLGMVAGGLDGSVRTFDRYMAKDEPDTWPGYTLSDFCTDFRRAG